MPRLLLFLLLLLLLPLTAPATAQIAVRADTVFTMAGPPIPQGVVLVRDGKIERVGPAARVAIPDGYRVLQAAIVTPGLIDAHSVVGLAGQYNQPHDQDQLETSAPLQPQLRALDAYNAREALVTWLRDLGVTTVHTGHGPGALIAGQTMIVKTHGTTLAEALVDSTTMLAATLGPGVSRRFDTPGTRAKSVAMLREVLVGAQAYRDKQDAAAADDEKEAPGRDLEKEVLADVLRGRLPLMITAQEVPEIMAALRLADEFGFRLVLDGAAEAYLVTDLIKSAGVPVLLHPPMVRPGGEMKSASLETAARLHAAGIPFAFQSGYEAYVPKTRVVLFEAAVAAAHGLGRMDALAALTRNAAALLGIADRVGTLEAGKDADLVLFDGDPFEYTSHVCGVLIDGEVVSETCK